MYTIYKDGQLLYAPNLSTLSHIAMKPKLTVELNKAGSLSFILPTNNVAYNDINKLKSVITVYRDSEELFRGRVLEDEKDFYNRKNVYCEGELSFLLDSIQRPYVFTGDIPDLFRYYVNEHNGRVDDWKNFEIGEITVTDSNNYIARSNSDYVNTLDEMTAKLIDTHGGYLRPRLHNGVRYLDYVKDYGKVSSQTIEFGVNLLDITEYITAENVFTVLIPLGAEMTNEDGSSAGRINIVCAENNFEDYIEDEAAIALFGRIERVEQWDDVTLQSNLLRKGKEFLQNGIEMAVTLNVNAVDLHHINVNTEAIHLGDYVRVISLPHNLDTYFLCSKIVYDLENPANTEFTFGVTFTAMTDKQVNATKNTQSTVTNINNAAQSAQNSANQANNAVKEVKQIVSNITPGNYVTKTAFEAYKDEINTKISAVYRFKGSVDTVELLPVSTQEIGDTYNVIDTGANYAWTQNGWDKLSETVIFTEEYKQSVVEDVIDALTAAEGVGF
jgi:phage minor structural protein